MFKTSIILSLSFFIILSACANNEDDPVLNQDCISNSDCPLGYYCDLATEKCASLSNSDGNLLPDGGGSMLPDDENLNDDNNDYSSKGEVTCDCFGKTYTVPYKFEKIQGWCVADDDGDGIPNCIEVSNGVEVDTDEDKTPDYLDLDSDGDGISDSAECPELPCRDTDENGVPDYRDIDSDGDRIPDNVECFSDPCVDTDGDGSPDYLDTDSDDDGVPDLIETVKDTDKNGIPNFLDLDSDGDGITDSEECPTLPCADSDKDGIPDFMDLDSDGDGLPDNQEVNCPTLGIHSRTQADTDGDGFSDLAEILISSDPCNPAEGIFDKGVKFYFELPYQGAEDDDILTFSPQVKKADIAFNVDTTGSMNDEISNLRKDLKTYIAPEIKNRISDSAIAVTQFGDPNEIPLIKTHPTTDLNAAQSAVEGLQSCGGGTYPEGGYWSLYTAVNTLTWRDATIPIFLHITDATSHEQGATRNQAVSALQAKSAKVVTVFSGNDNDAVNQLNDLSNSTGAVVPACANAGRTTLLYQIPSNGTQLDTSVVSGIDALVKYASFSLFVVPADDGDGGTIDTACFLKKIEALEYVPFVNGCNETIVATPAAFNGSTYNNGFNNFTTGTSSAANPGNKLTFKVTAQNDTCYESLGVAKMFKAFINVIDNATGSVLDTQEVTIIVPGKVSGSDA